LKAHRLERRALRVQKIARIASLEQVLEFRRIERVPGVVAFVEFNLEIIAQETSCVTTGGSGRFPEKARFLHMVTNPVEPAANCGLPPLVASTRCFWAARLSRPSNAPARYPRPSAAQLRW